MGGPAGIGKGAPKIPEHDVGNLGLAGVKKQPQADKAAAPKGRGDHVTKEAKPKAPTVQAQAQRGVHKSAADYTSKIAPRAGKEGGVQGYKPGEGIPPQPPLPTQSKTPGH